MDSGVASLGPSGDGHRCRGGRSAGTIAAVTGVWPRNPGTSEPAAVALRTQDDGDAGEDVFAEIENDEAWALVRTLAEDLDHDEMEGEGVSARPGAADHLTSELSGRSGSSSRGFSRNS